MNLLALHGSTMNGELMRKQLDFVQRAIPDLDVIAPDAPHAASMDVIDHLYEVWKEPRLPPPHYLWWDATDDGREYRGWQATRDLMRAVIPAGPVGILGFSQGAILAAAIAAMSAHGDMPPIAFVILVAGRPPRSDAIRPFLAQPITVPSLHIWGANDPLIGDTSAALVELFHPATREVVVWPGAHSLPATGPAAAAIVELIGHWDRA